LAKPAVLEELRASGLKRVTANEPMSRHTTWRIGGPADYFGIAETAESLARAATMATRLSMPWLVLGGGSNILVSDQGIAGLVILNRIKTLDVTPEPGGATVEAGSGVFFARLAHFTAKRGYAGLEWGVAIPGTVGAGVVNNAGAHHGDVQKALLKAEVINARGDTQVLEPSALGFTYRKSALKHSGEQPVRQTASVVTRCWFRVRVDTERSALSVIERLQAQRLETQPITEASAGSTFKNPDSDSAGRLIEAAGLKGTVQGRAEISAKHANFIVNRGNASAADVIELMRRAREVVLDRFGVCLEPEIQLVGRWAAGLETLLGQAANC